MIYAYTFTTKWWSMCTILQQNDDLCVHLYNKMMIYVYIAFATKWWSMCTLPSQQNDDPCVYYTFTTIWLNMLFGQSFVCFTVVPHRCRDNWSVWCHAWHQCIDYRGVVPTMRHHCWTVHVTFLRSVHSMTSSTQMPHTSLTYCFAIQSFHSSCDTVHHQLSQVRAMGFLVTVL